jgi:hypothetical protein
MLEENIRKAVSRLKENIKLNFEYIWCERVDWSQRAVYRILWPVILNTLTKFEFYNSRFLFL